MELFIEQIQENAADQMIACIEAKEISWDNEEGELIVTIDAIDENTINLRDLKVYIINDEIPFRSCTSSTRYIDNLKPYTTTEYIPYTITEYKVYKQVCVVTLQSMSVHFWI